MELLGNIFSWFMAIFVMSIFLSWVWIFYHKIKCRKVQSCEDRKCKYWEWCEHNCAERKKDQTEMLQQMVRKWGLDEDNLNKEMK